MIQKKICMLGERATGKTSLVARFVRSIFSEKYLSTIGVKIDRKVVICGEREINLVLWDIEGESQFRRVRASYLQGSSGFVLVADGTRPDTLETALEIRRRLNTDFGTLPCILAVNKSDLHEDWAITAEQMTAIDANDCHVIQTSAKTGLGVEAAFSWLADAVTS